MVQDLVGDENIQQRICIMKKSILDSQKCSLSNKSIAWELVRNAES